MTGGAKEENLPYELGRLKIQGILIGNKLKTIYINYLLLCNLVFKFTSGPNVFKQVYSYNRLRL